MISIKNQEEFKSNLKEAGEKLVILNFSAHWNTHSKMIAPQVDALSYQFGESSFLEIDVDKCEDIALAYAVFSVPTFLFIKKGKILENFSTINTNEIRKAIQKFQ